MIKTHVSDISGIKNNSPKKGEQNVVWIKISDIIKMHETGDVSAYQNNRGDFGYSRKTFSNVYKNFRPIGLGALSLVVRQDGRCMIADGNSRAAAIIKMWEDGKLDEEKLNHLIPSILYNEDDAIEAYKVLNTAQRHTLKETLTNPDLFMGKVKLKMEGHFKEISSSNEEFLCRLDLLAALHAGLLMQEKESPALVLVPGRVMIERWAREEATSKDFFISIEDSHYERVGAAVNAYIDFKNQLLSENTIIGKDGNPIIRRGRTQYSLAAVLVTKNKGIQASFLLDYLTGGICKKDDASVLSKRMTFDLNIPGNKYKLDELIQKANAVAKKGKRTLAVDGYRIIINAFAGRKLSK